MDRKNRRTEKQVTKEGQMLGKGIMSCSIAKVHHPFFWLTFSNLYRKAAGEFPTMAGQKGTSPDYLKTVNE